MNFLLSKLRFVSSIEISEYGGLAEWSKAVVLKTIDLYGSAGSNPVSSAIFFSETCPSGRREHLAKVSNRLTVPRVRISPSPPFLLTLRIKKHPIPFFLIFTSLYLSLKDIKITSR